ncbi:cation diffusion facilitator family transporter [Candidatus Borrarchaeum sp.]|uniref:cation diffusion facilitator family transporter n=1 Tax=Candidatus Borrarchaeum sp. TaxID=2846742 RepID=UPI00257F1AA5|nr:cation diffusion facilitator family transporter [Candidatus Borrarchaeum sp.]
MFTRYDAIKRTLIIILIVNLSVALLKGIYGGITNSLSLIADAFHSLFDASSNVIGLIGIRLARKPADTEHPYGHWKYETVSAIIIAAMIFLTGVEIIESAIERFIAPATPEVTVVSFIIVIATIVINFITTIYEEKRGKAFDSSILLADALHTRSDIFVSASVLVSFIGILLGFPIIDPIIAVFVAVMIFHTGFEIAKESIEVLVDTSVIDPSKIQSIVNQIEGVSDSHKIRSRGQHNEISIDLHVTVDPEISVHDGHDIADNVEKTLIEKVPGVRDVTVHIGPAGHPECEEY